jgi:hypothetical protein
MSTPDADEQLRQTVAGLAPEAGTADPARRTSVPVIWRGTRVAELAADGDADPAELETIAAGIADLCLVGWDTGGETWES